MWLMQRLFERNVSPDDEKIIIKCIAELKKDYLPDEDPLKIRAAIDIRLRRFAELKELYGLADTESSMFGIVTSRAIDLGDGTSAVIPMLDMVNHSMNPNLSLSIDFEDRMMDMKATRRIEKGEEMFICYQDEESPGYEFGSLWVSQPLNCTLDFDLLFTIMFDEVGSSMGNSGSRIRNSSRATDNLIENCKVNFFSTYAQ